MSHDPAGDGDEQGTAAGDSSDLAQLGSLALPDGESTCGDADSAADPHKGTQDAIPHEEGTDGAGGVEAVNEEEVALSGETQQENIQNMVECFALLLLAQRSLLINGFFGHVLKTSESKGYNLSEQC